MALTNEQWELIQQRSCDPHRSVESNIVNKHTRIRSLGKDLILIGAEVLPYDYQTVTVKEGKFIKDDVYIEINQAVFLNFNDPDNYVVNDGSVMDTAGDYWVVLEYVYAEALPPHIARIKIAKEKSQITDWHIILSKVPVDFISPPDRYELVPPFDDSVRFPWIDYNPGFFISENFPYQNDQVVISAGKFIKLTHSGGALYPGGFSDPFDPIVNPGWHRYDWLCINDDKVISVIKGTEQATLGDPTVMAPPLVPSKYGLALIHIYNTGAVGDELVIYQKDIIQFAEAMNSGIDNTGQIPFISLTDTPSSYTGQADTVVRVKLDETGVEFIPRLNAFGVIKTEKKTDWDGIATEWQLSWTPDHNHFFFIISDGVIMEKGNTFDWYWKPGNDDTIVFNTPPANFTEIIEMYSQETFQTFLDMVDTPNTYLNKEGRLVRVKSDGTGIEFISPETSGGGTIKEQTIPDDTVYVEPFSYIRPSDGKKALYFNGGNSPQFLPAPSGQTRFDILLIDDNKVLSIVQGSPVVNGSVTTPHDLAPEIPYDKLLIAIIRINEDVTVVVNTDDITPAMEDYNKGAGQYPSFLQISDVSDSSYSGKGTDYIPAVNSTEDGIELVNKKIIETANNQTNSLRVGMDNILKTNIYHDGSNGYVNTEAGDLYLDSASGNIRSHGQIYNAVYNDFADSLPLAPGQPKVPGKAYCVNHLGQAYVCDKRGAINTVGICSDVYGFCCGKEGDGFVEIGVAGWVPAYCDKRTYKPGTRLISLSNGILTEAITDEEKMDAIAKFMYNRGDGRSWVKVL